MILGTHFPAFNCVTSVHVAGEVPLGIMFLPLRRFHHCGKRWLVMEMRVQKENSVPNVVIVPPARTVKPSSGAAGAVFSQQPQNRQQCNHSASSTTQLVPAAGIRANKRRACRDEPHVCDNSCLTPLPARLCSLSGRRKKHILPSSPTQQSEAVEEKKKKKWKEHAQGTLQIPVNQLSEPLSP